MHKGVQICVPHVSLGAQPSCDPFHPPKVNELIDLADVHAAHLLPTQNQTNNTKCKL